MKRKLKKSSTIFLVNLPSLYTKGRSWAAIFGELRTVFPHNMWGGEPEEKQRGIKESYIVDIQLKYT